MTFAEGYIIFGAVVLLAEAFRILRTPQVVLTDLESNLPTQSAINFRALAGGAPLSTAMFLSGGLYFGADRNMLLAYLALVLATVGVIRLLASIGKPGMSKQYVAVAVEIGAAAAALALALASNLSAN